MQDWADGYVVDVGYTHGYFRELSPALLRFVALLGGVEAPRAGPFGYCELGCGNGYSTALHAAANPQGSFVGADFNPTHIHNAQRLARDAGLDNVRFLEKSFDELRNEALPAADAYPLAFRQGRSLTQFHGFYDHGQALPTLARVDPEPVLWLAPADARARGVEDGAAIRVFNAQGAFAARARVTDRVPAGTVWMRDGWTGLNRLTSGRPSVPDEATEVFPFSAGQAAFDAMVEVAPA